MICDVTRMSLILLGALVLGGCGADDGRRTPARKPPTAAQRAVLDRCAPTPAAAGTSADTFPPGLLPGPSRVVAADTGSARAVVALPLREALLALRDNAVAAGFVIRGQDYEGVEAELELEGPDGDIGLRLTPASCGRATQVVSRAG